MLEHLQAEHHKLNCTLSAIQHRIDDPALRDTPVHAPSDFVAGLQVLRAKLLTHFAEEGIDGCLGEAAVRCPSAAAQLKAIKADHQSLMDAVDELIASAKGVATSDTLSRRIHSLSERLHVHEVAETHLLQYALGGDAADYDVEGED